MITMDKDTYCSVLRVHSKELIAQEGKTLTDLLLNVHNSAVNLSLIPFCALYCRSAKEFFGEENTESEIEKEVKDIRSGLKVFTGKYSKGKKWLSSPITNKTKFLGTSYCFHSLKILIYILTSESILMKMVKLYLIRS